MSSERMEQLVHSAQRRLHRRAALRVDLERTRTLSNSRQMEIPTIRRTCYTTLHDDLDLCSCAEPLGIGDGGGAACTHERKHVFTWCNREACFTQVSGDE